MKAENEEKAEREKSADELIREQENFADVGYDREFYETIYGAPGEFPAMEY